jgi:hypothetical protein
MEDYLGYYQVISIRKPSQVDFLKAKAILGMTPPRCRQVDYQDQDKLAQKRGALSPATLVNQRRS